ncbi:ribbon-helix-helix domain-containing protein [Pseudokordiimonas caeni]|uniref:ribbon-helix-helix domain-containing protein n=1 Tax=Pseudokordiimonas caeni TaxID=2997908 RepID=UPI0028124F72|nr:ribbon-helix-helix domain-containing protein [Pseudokordiimonas caeni]
MLDLNDATLEKHSVTLAGHRTSISLERGFWRHLRRLADEEGLAINELVRLIDEARTGSLSGALRAYVLQNLERQLSTPQA